MTDRVDVDADATSDATFLKNNGQRMLRSRGLSTMVHQEDLIDLSEPQQEGSVNITREDLGGRRLEQPTATKPKLQLFVSNLLGLSPNLRNSQQELYSMNIEDHRECLEAQENAKERLEKRITKATGKIEHLESKIEAMEQQHEAEKENSLEEIARLNEQINDLGQTNDRLRQMLVPVSGKQTLDAEVVTKFVSLRMSILGLVRQTWTTKLRDGIDLRRLSGYQREFFRSNHPITHNRLRFLVFSLVHGNILGSQGYFLGDGFEQLGQLLLSAERELSKISSKENRKEIMQWRNATFKATEAFRNDGHRMSFATQKEIWNILAPLQPKNADAEQNGKKKLKAICDNAVELSLMIRQLKDDFRVYDLAGAVGQRVSKCEEFAEEIESVATENGRQSGTIAYVIMGALAKKPQENLDQNLVLEKAEVAVYRKQLELTKRDAEWTLADYIIADIISKLAASEAASGDTRIPPFAYVLHSRSHVFMTRTHALEYDQILLPTMAFWVNYIIRTALILEDYIVERILRSPGFHNTVRRIHRKVQDQRHGRDPNEPLRPGEATELPGPNENKSFPKYFVEELMNQFRGSPTNPQPPPGPPRKPR
ncbi:hypothetical protein INS49_004132 [Diaporthe citri]|uniref:uncharacterized protein n=1 Tax=Diaporthe citri TaxID=83186 RepID=UPI001C7EA67C|nr:uncharacterized protein INS49_004132 [Diaporthe citri]KAG6355051.1 hypothetical protein INS49_004132 [Diaporthe citri]